MIQQTQILLLFFAAMAAMMVYLIGRVLSTWSEHHISRHRLIVESTRRRNEYLQALAEREQAYTAELEEQIASVMEPGHADDAVGTVELVEPAELAQAA